MAVIGKIRQRSGLVIGVIFVSLLAFILTDAFSSNSSLFNRQENTVGKIGGTKIKFEDFDKKVNEVEENYRKQYGEVPGELQGMIRDQVWENFFKDLVLKKQYEKMGITISPEELTWIEFKAPEPAQRLVSYFTNPQEGQIFEQFRNPMGQLDLSKALGHRQQLEEGSDEEKQWIEYIDNGIMEETQNKKYFTYLRQVSHVTALEAKEDFAATNNNVKAQIVKLDYFSIADSTIKVTDAELSEYLQKHPEDFKQEDSRKMEYVAFNIFPSKEDSATTLKWAIEKTEALKQTANDSIYIVNNGGMYDTTFKRRGSFAQDAEGPLFSAEKGTVVGPLYKDGAYKIYKVLDAKNDSILFYNAAHILIRPEGITKDDTINARKKAADVLAQIRGGKSFEDAVKEFSLDPGTNTKGGDLGWFEKKSPMLPKDLVDAVTRTRNGDYTIVATGQGVHLVKVTAEPSSRMIKVAEISRVVEPGKETLKSISNKAAEFYGSASNEEQFNQMIEKMGMSKRIADQVGPNDQTFSGINDARRVVLWAFNDDRKVGDISEPMDVDGNSKIIIARIVSIREKGTAKVEDVREKLEEQVRKEKKAAQLRQKMQDALNGATSLDQVAQKLNTQVIDIPYQTFISPNVTSIGMEPRLLGYLFGSEKNKITGPIKGQAGVFVFNVTALDEAKAPEKLDEVKLRMVQQVASGSEMRATEALRKLADIKDMRYKFY